LKGRDEKEEDGFSFAYYELNTASIFAWDSPSPWKVWGGRGIDIGSVADIELMAAAVIEKFDGTFEDVLFSLQSGRLLDDLVHPNKNKYPKQRTFIVEVAEYA